ncbi:uncharacterized protein LOC129604764 [Betta splendens]|uniref:Uncharacterized protein LOC129604764 n=1 Tax=Betta splendens TaxID=158456 RepID=A0A9W2Y3P9_BETSP|nr:uncharacterized protein LOC129604764 [Betta splendens]
MILLLLLGAFVSVGLADVVEETNGATYIMDLPTDTYSIEFEGYDETALELNLRKIDPPYGTIAITVGVVALIGCCCCCVQCCKVLASSVKTVSEPAVAPPEYSYEPAAPWQPSQRWIWMPPYPVPAYTHSNPLVQNPPAVNAANAEVPAPTVLSLSDDEPRFELKGMHFPLSLPLSSDPTYQHVYTSDKLNFKWKPSFTSNI